MELTALNQPNDLRRTYFQILGVSNPKMLEDGIVQSLLNVVRSRTGDNLPIRLSIGVQQFLINPTPVMDDSVQDGRIKFDPSTKRFVITLSTRCHRDRSMDVSNLLPQIWGADASHWDLSFIPRLRFTYAHEVAHRFFFVERDTTWIRAVELATAGAHAPQRLRAYRILNQLEETLCNNIAGRVLLPDDLLSQKIGPSVPGQNQRDAISFSRTVEKVAKLFAVSQECLLVRIQKAIEGGVISLQEKFCVILFAYSEKKGGFGKSKWKVRVQVPIVPRLLGQVPLRQIFPGMGLENLGEEAVEFAFSALNSWPRERSGNIELPLVFLSRRPIENDNYLRTRLKGWWHTLNRSEDVGEGKILVWGYLSN